MNDHYEFANTLFYAIVETLDTAPQPQTRAEPDPLPEGAPRVYASVYAGVTVYKERWYISNWSMDKKPKHGRLRPRTPEGERLSATDRAQALGLDYLERRDGRHEPLC